MWGHRKTDSMVVEGQKGRYRINRFFNVKKSDFPCSISGDTEGVSVLDHLKSTSKRISYPA